MEDHTYSSVPNVETGWIFFFFFFRGIVFTTCSGPMDLKAYFALSAHRIFKIPEIFQLA